MSCCHSNLFPGHFCPAIRGQREVSELNAFIWKGRFQKKVVVNKEIAELPHDKGGLAIPNLIQYWNSLKLAWISRLIATDDSSAWKRLSMAKLGTAMNIPSLSTSRLLAEGPHTISKAADTLSNPFWKSLFKLMPQVEGAFYKSNSVTLGERCIWGNSDYLLGGKPLSRKLSSPKLVKNFNQVQDFISKKTNVLLDEAEVTEIIGRENVSTWNQIAEKITTQLTSKGLTWHSIIRPVTGPHHEGWSRMVSETWKAKKFHPLLSAANGSQARNINERFWTSEGLTTYSDIRWDSLWKNHSRLRCNLRVKFEEWRVLWGRQELNHYKDKYAPLPGGNSVACSYCHNEIETEKHLYVECEVTGEFWQSAKYWFSQVFRVNPTLALKGPRLFGLEKEQPSDLLNIFYRCARYCIYNNRNKTSLPSLEFFANLVRDELKIKYQGAKFTKYAASPEEAAAIRWMQVEMGWNQTLPEKLYPASSKYVSNTTQ